MTQYIYPQNLKATANLVYTHLFIPAAVTLCYAFLTIRMEDTTMLDYMKYAVKFLISTQQYFEWR